MSSTSGLILRSLRLLHSFSALVAILAVVTFHDVASARSIMRVPGAIDLPHDVMGALSLELTATPDPARTTERITFEILACNSGDTDVTGATITHLVPAGASFTVRSDGGTCTTGSCSTGAMATWNLGTIAAHRCQMVRMAPVVTAGTVDGTIISFVSTLTVDGGATVDDTLEVTVAAAPALALEIADNADPIPASGVIDYTVAFGNRSAQNVLDTAITVPVPAGTTLLTIEDGGSEAAGEITWTIGTLRAGENGRRRFSVTVDPSAVDGTAVVASGEITGTGHSARATQATAVVGAEEMSLHVAAAPDAVALNSRILHDITLCNGSGLEATGVVLDSLIPNGLSFTVVTDGATCTTGSCSTGAIPTWNLGVLAAGRCRTIQASINAAAVADGELIRPVFRLRADGGALATATRTVARDTTPVLGLALHEDRAPVAAGESLTYTLTYGVPQATNALATSLRAWVPAGTTVSAISAGGTESDGIITWDLGTLRAGESGRQWFSVDVDGDAGDGTALDATAQIDADSAATFGALASRSTTINGEQDLALRMNAMPDPVRRNERFIHDMTICNSSSQDATGVKLDIVVPNDLSFVVGTDGATCTTGSCSTGSIATWNVGTVGPHRCSTLITSINNASTTDGELLTVGARVQADDRQMAVALRPVVSDNTPSLALTLFDDRDPSLPGDPLTYTLRAANRSASENVTDVELRLPVPAGSAVTWISDDGSEADGVITWPLGTLAAGDIVQRQVMVTLDGSLPDGGPVFAEAELTGGALEKFGARASQTTSIVTTEILSLDLVAWLDPIKVNDRLFYDLTICNHSALEATGVVADIRHPNYVGFLRGSDGPTCTTGSCAVGSLATWTIGDIPAGRCRTIGVGSTVAGAAAGDLIPLAARVRADGGALVTAGRGVGVNSAQRLTTALVEQRDPIGPGTRTTHQVWFGNRGPGNLTTSDLRAVVPPNATVVTATGNPILEGNELTWPLCPLSAGQSGTFSFTVDVDDVASLTDGAVVIQDGAALTSEARLSAPDGAAPMSHASASTGVLASAPLRLTMTASPTIAKQLDQITYSLEACNDSIDQVTGVSIGMFAPQGTTVVMVNDGGAVTASTEIQWAIDSINASECASVSVVVRMNSAGSYPGDGTVVFATARLIVDGDETAVASAAVRACNVDASACAVRPPPPCAAPQSRACNRTASDALAVLRRAVGLRECPLCECDVDGSGSVSATDALLTLRFSVGQPVVLRCPPCF